MKKNLLYVAGITIVFLFLSANSLSTAQISEDILSELDKIHDAIRSAEKGLFNIKVDSECWREKWDPDNNEWIKDTEVSMACTSWFNGLPKSKTRVDVHKEILKWVDGDAPYAEDVYSLGFDGQSARKVHHRSGPINKTFEMREAYITSEPSKDLYSPWFNVATGARFSLFLHNNSSGALMSDYFKVPDDGVVNARLEITHEKFEGIECVKYGSGHHPGVGEQAYWFDPARGYALIGTKHVNIRQDGTEWLIESIKVRELKEVSKGVWWPTKATVEGEDPNSGKLIRSVYQASNVVINDPAFNEEIFTVPIPSGYYVEDQINNISYKSGLDPEQLLDVLDETVEKSLNVGDAELSSDSVDEEEHKKENELSQISDPNSKSEVRALQDNEQQPHRRQSFVLYLAIGIGVVLAVLCLILLKRKNKTIITALIISFFLTNHQIALAETQIQRYDSTSKDEYNWNCGFNVTYVALRFFQKEIVFPSVVKQLNIGRQFKRNATFLDIKNCLEKNELLVSGYKANSPKEIVDFAKPGHILIIREHAYYGDQDIGHFIVFRRIQDRFQIIDPPYSPKSFTSDIDLPVSGWSGEFLDIIDCPQTSIAGPIMRIENKMIVLEKLGVTS